MRVQGARFLLNLVSFYKGIRGGVCTEDGYEELAWHACHSRAL